MEQQFIMLAIIMGVAFIAPYIASLIPGRPIPETVFLIFIGTLMGPFGLKLVDPHITSLEFLNELGLAFLFLLAGYEIEVPNLVGRMGKHASISWFVSLAMAICIVFLVPTPGISGIGKTAVAIAMTTTAYGTLAPIMRDRKLTKTKVGNAISTYGTIGELFPIIAMAILLSSRAHYETILILVLFSFVCLLAAWLPQAAKNVGSKVINFLRDNSETASQAPVRLTVLLLVALVAMSALLSLDAVLGAFAAGFVLRRSLPKGDKLLDTKLEGIAFGFLVPIFFVTSGAEIDLSAVSRNPTLLVAFMMSLLAVRTIPIMISLRLSPETAEFTYGQRISTAIYCTMALPLIVAVTSVAVATHTMTDDVASVLISAGALTILIVPVVTSLTIRIGASHPVQAVMEIAHTPHDVSDILHDHAKLLHDAGEDFLRHRKYARKDGSWLSSADYLAQGILDKFEAENHTSKESKKDCQEH